MKMKNENEMVEINQYDIQVARDPETVLKEAKTAATALMSVVSQKKDPVIFNHQLYLEFEDWQTVARFYGLTARVTRTTFLDFGGVKGFEASADAIRADGMIVSSADSMCLNDEDNWSTRSKYEYVNGKRTKAGDVPVPLFQLRSMAQTRACAKALRNVLAWVVVLAGFKPNVAEEITGNEPSVQQSFQKPQLTAAAMNPAEFRKMKSKFAGRCSKCDGPVTAGQEILYHSKLGVYHPGCLSGPPSPEPADQTPVMSKAILSNLQKMAELAGISLIDRIGADGLESLEMITREYANELLKEFSQGIDAKK